MIKQIFSNPNFFSSTINLSDSLYLVDILDIIFISIMIYFALFFLKQRRSLLAVLGVGVIIAVYGIAQVFNLYLTSLVLQSFFGVFLIILAIAFQDELRRFFEYLASLGTRQIKLKRSPTISSPLIDIIIQAVTNLSHNKIGGLLVIQGNENMDHYLDGGELLDGIMTEAILESIFDPKSPGHDGAVIISKNRITKFGAQLPLSKNFKEIRRRGTRHSAGLGISEKTDALTIIVSEEKGTISIAQDGKLREVKNAEDLEKKITKFLKEKFPQELHSMWKNLVRKNSGIKLASMGIAITLWFFSLSQAGTVQKDFTVPITYKSVSETTIIENTKPSEFTVTLTGRGQAIFNRLQEGDVEIIINGKDIKNGINNIILEKDFVKRPLQVSVLNITPANVRITAQEYEIFEIPVQIRQVGELSPGTEIEKIEISPSKISLLVALGLPTPKTIFTEVIDISDLVKTKTFDVKFDLQLGTRLKKEQKNEVSVTISVK